MRGLSSIFFLFGACLIGSIMQEQECKILFTHGIKIILKSYFGVKTLGLCHMCEDKKRHFTTFPENM